MDLDELEPALFQVVKRIRLHVRYAGDSKGLS